MSRVLRELGLGPVWRLRDRPVDAPAEIEVAAAPVVPLAPPPATVAAPVVDGDRTAAIAAMGWDDLGGAVADCRACVLCKTRKQAVLGVGDVQADWLFVGEGPGAEEDERGEPFVGQAGKLLDAMLAALDLRRGENVYIANTVKCRPPNNRTPEAEETAACWPFLARQIALIRPKLIVALGRPAAQTLLQMEVKIAATRGRLMEHQGIPLIVTYHPAYLLRNLPDKAKAWEDLCFMRKTMAGLA
ncbi:Type-4 uracil-DNA glycosylase [Rhodocyclaceae bacterium]|nr:Type-4 uracil-DNA glycosylase [Rhodocyclaceae bacterium]